MANVVVVGSQWGDEGKGKIVDWLSERADVVVRFQGGHNAGHTLVIDGTTYKLSLLPSGIVRKGKISFIGNGVVVDPWALQSEIMNIQSQGIEVSPENLRISEGAAIILPLHKNIDTYRESARGNEKIGTTGRGIGPAYEDKIARRGLKMSDLLHNNIESKINELLLHHNALLRGFGGKEINKDKLMGDLRSVSNYFAPYIVPVWLELNDLKDQGKRILFEGAQGAMLDIDQGTYPFVTSSNTTAGAAATGSGLGPKAIDYVLGITKAYTTRVGSGPFPTELLNGIGEQMGERGKEFGTVTGRKRRCGWFDAVMVRQAVKINSMDGIALTKIDVLDGFEELKVCIGYEHRGRRYDYLPSGCTIQSEIKPIYETLEGWKESTFGARSWKDLPAEAIKYIKRIEDLIGIPVALLSTSPEREDTILVKDPFVK